MNSNFKICLAVYVIAFWLNTVNCTWPVFNFYSREKDHSNFTQHVEFSKDINSRKTYFIIHGFNGRGDDDYILTIKDELLKREDANIFAIDWSEGSSGYNYYDVANNAKKCASDIVQFIHLSNINPKSIHCIGHSLGAHICGFVGKKTKLARISAMDPAGPLFKGASAYGRLDKGDADYVDVLHGDGLIGIQDELGHKDFYPNGGAKQPNCSPIGRKRRFVDFSGVLDSINQNLNIGGIFNTVNEKLNFGAIYNGIMSNLNNLRTQAKYFVGCSHLRVTYLFAESINSDCKFYAVKCSNYNGYKNLQCDPYVGAEMGFNSINSTETGRFYLDTNSQNPFCKGSSFPVDKI